MSFLDQITVLILTKDEAPNIKRTLEALRRFPEVVVLDSGSVDDTTQIVEDAPNARLITRRFDNHAAQWNFGVQALSGGRPWVLALDADYILPERLVNEIASLAPSASVAGFRATFRYCVDGSPLRGSLYPPNIVLFRRNAGSYVQDGHTQRLCLPGEIAHLDTPIRHDDRKPFARWIASQVRYAALEAEHLLATTHSSRRFTDRVRLTGWLAPLLVAPYTLLAKACLFDGRAGWIYTLQRIVAECMIALALHEARRRANATRNEHTEGRRPAPTPEAGQSKC